MQIPDLKLSAGQLLWVLNRGRPADARLRNEVRYLRLLGVPHAEGEATEGRGHRIFYGYEDLIELGVAIYAIRHGVKVNDAARILTTARQDFRSAFRMALEDQPDAALRAEWVKTRGKIGACLVPDMALRLHDRYSRTPGKFELISPGAKRDPNEDLLEMTARIFTMSEQFDDGEERVLVPLTRIALELTAWALEAPAIRPGRVARS